MKKIIISIFLMLALVLASCSNENTQKDDYKMTISAPSGAPAIAAAELVTTYSNDYDYTFGLAANALGPLFVNKTSDAIIAPINLGAKQYKANGNYVLAAVLTWGNLYFASQKSEFKLESLNNSDVVFFGEGTVNDMVIKYVLGENNITPKTITYLGSTQETQSKLLTDSEAIVLVAEPALTVAKQKNSEIKSISVQDLYKTASGNDGFPQAGCFINKDTIENHKESVNAFLEKLEASALACNTKTEEVAGYAEVLELGGKKPVLTKAIPGCNIKYVKAIDAKGAIDYAAGIDSTQFGGAPVTEFYYEY